MLRVEQTVESEEDEMTDQDEHKAKMERLKASVDRRIEAAQEEKGLLIVYTGAGKGKRLPRWEWRCDVSAMG